MKNSIPAQAIQSIRFGPFQTKESLFKKYYEKFLKEKGWVDLQAGFPLRKFFPSKAYIRTIKSSCKNLL